MAENIRNIVIIGAGQAGGWAARTLRSEGYAGDITLIGDERHPPYERPPLSKAVLAGEAEPQSTYLFGTGLFADLDIGFLRGETATQIETEPKRVRCASGKTVPYERLILTTGGRARQLSIDGLDSGEILTLRTLEDAFAITERFSNAASVAIIGGGWIGLEVAATARNAGLDVHLFEIADRLCNRAAPSLLSEYLLRLHRQQGIEIHLESAVTAAKNRPSGRCELEAKGGTRLEVDMIIAGIGLVPNDHLAREAGLVVDNGIVTDQFGLTSDPNIFAAGDAANSLRPKYGRHIRLESWANAQDQGIVVAKAMLGMTPEPEELPWFWSDQYDANIQIAGIPDETMTCIVRGEPASGSFSAFYLRGDEIRAAIAVNKPQDMTVARRLIASAITVDREDLANETIRLKALLRRRGK